METNSNDSDSERFSHESNFIYRYCQRHRANNGPPIHEAIKKFCLKTVTCYLDRCSFDIEAIDICGQRPLHCAVSSGFEAAVSLLLERGAKINGRDREGNTPLHHAVIKNNVKLVKFLIDKGCEIDMEGSNKQTPFLIAVKMKLPIMIELLLMKGCNVNAKDKYGNTPLHFIYKFKYWETFENLTDSDSNLDKPEDLNIVAGQRYCDSLSKLFIEKGADVNGKDENDQTPLHLVVLRNRRAMCMLFIANNADVNAKDKNGRTPLHLAVLRSDYIPICKVLFSNNADINARNKNGQTPLFYAVSRGDEELVKLLIHKKADVRFADNSGQTVLHIAAKVHLNLTSVVDLLLLWRAEVNVQDENGDTPLHCGVEYCLNNDDNLSVTSFFNSMLAWGACMQIRNNAGITPMDKASGNYSEDFFVKHLIKLESAKLPCHINHQLNLNRLRESFKEECLEELDNMQIITIGHYSLIDLFYKYDNATFLLSEEIEGIIKLSSLNELFPIYSPLLKATYTKSKHRQILLRESENCLNLNLPLNVVKIILNYVSDKDLENIVGSSEKSALRFLEFRPDLSDFLLLSGGGYQSYRGSPIHRAVRNHSLEELKTLLSQDSVNIETLDYIGETLLHCAVCNDFVLGLHLLLEKCANIDVKDENGNTLLHCAVTNRNELLVEFMINKGLDIDCENNAGKTPLHLAICEENIFIVEMLLERGCNVNKKDKSGYSPLHILLDGLYDINYYITICDLLLAKGADVNSRDNKENTPLHFALRTHKALPICELLLKNGANVNATNNKSRTPLHGAAYESDVSVCKVFLAKGAQINVRDKDGKTPLHCAVESERKDETVRFLLAKGSELGARDNNGMTALHIAARARDHDDVHCIKYLLEMGIEIDAQDGDGDTPLHHAVNTDYYHIDNGDWVPNTSMVSELLDWGASVKIKNNAGLTPLDKCLDSDKKEFFIKYIIKLQCANLMQSNVCHKFASAKFKSYQESCLEELASIKNRTFGPNTLYQVFSMYNNPRYLSNDEMKEALETDALKHEYPIYISLLKVTYIKAKQRLLLLNLVEDSLNIKLPSEILRKVLSYIDDKNLGNMTIF